MNQRLLLCLRSPSFAPSFIHPSIHPSYIAGEGKCKNNPPNKNPSLYVFSQAILRKHFLGLYCSIRNSKFHMLNPRDDFNRRKKFIETYAQTLERIIKKNHFDCHRCSMDGSRWRYMLIIESPPPT